MGLVGNISISFDGGFTFKPIVTGQKKVETWEKAKLSVVSGRVRDLWLVAPYGLLHSADNATPMANFRPGRVIRCVACGEWDVIATVLPRYDLVPSGIGSA